MPLIKCRIQDWEVNFAYAPPQVDCLLNTEDIVSVTPTESRGIGPFVSIKLRDGTTLTAVGRPYDFSPDPLEPVRNDVKVMQDGGQDEVTDDRPLLDQIAALGKAFSCANCGPVSKYIYHATYDRLHCMQCKHPLRPWTIDNVGRHNEALFQELTDHYRVRSRVLYDKIKTSRDRDDDTDPPDGNSPTPTWTRDRPEHRGRLYFVVEHRSDLVGVAFLPSEGDDVWVLGSGVGLPARKIEWWCGPIEYPQLPNLH